jgi:hypothetical protein
MLISALNGARAPSSVTAASNDQRSATRAMLPAINGIHDMKTTLAHIFHSSRFVPSKPDKTAVVAK